MLQFEGVVVIASLRTETNFLNLDLFLFGLLFLFTFFLLVKELLVVSNSTNRRNSSWRYFDEVKFLLISYLLSLFDRIDTLFNIFTNKTNLRNTNLFVSPVKRLIVLLCGAVAVDAIISALIVFSSISSAYSRSCNTSAGRSLLKRFLRCDNRILL